MMGMGQQRGGRAGSFVQFPALPSTWPQGHPASVLEVLAYTWRGQHRYRGDNIELDSPPEGFWAHGGLDGLPICCSWWSLF